MKQITVTELEEMLDEAQTDRLYIDVREIDEYAAGHIEEFINYPLSTLEETMEQLPKDKEIVIICRSGNRSMQAASMLIDAGFPMVTNVQGAMLEWKRDVVVGDK
ncbi:MAG TPA: rhodanese-like domain-containing protein [Bacilli bacterium]|nr:rhodanese-like domain-containing protein [Bacilli bacterium]